MGNCFKKRKLRKIVVNNKNYYWGVGNLNCDGDSGLELRIYHNDDIILNTTIQGKITPKDISLIIMNNEL